jgi:hypothetical protein
MKKILLLLILFVGGLIPLFAQTTVAVLPYTISYEGRVPQKYTPEMIAEMQEQDGQNYQSSMINSLTRISLKRSNLAADVTVLSLGQMEGLLLVKKMTYQQLATMTNEQIADSLGVTHVIRGTATRTFIMSDEMSLGMTAIGVITNQNVINITSQINLINALEERAGTTLFSRGFIRTTSAVRSDDQSLRDTFRKSSRKMFKRLEV